MSVIGTRIPKHESAFSRWLRGFAGYRKYGALTLMFIPVVLYFFVFKYIPMGGIVMAFENFKIRKGILGSEWIWFQNFIDFFNSVYFWRLIRNTILISVYGLIYPPPGRCGRGSSGPIPSTGPVS